MYLARVPVEGRKLRNGSSAYTRASMDQPGRRHQRGGATAESGPESDITERGARKRASNVRTRQDPPGETPEVKVGGSQQPGIQIHTPLKGTGPPSRWSGNGRPAATRNICQCSAQAGVARGL